jgi:transposase
MSKSYRPYNPDQQFLLAPSMREWLPECHLVYFVSDTIDEMDISAIESYYEKSLVGYPPYHPRMMAKLLVYAYCTGVFSSRKIAKKLEEDVAFRVLAAGNRPDFRTISDFRKLHLASLKVLFGEVLVLCSKAGMVRLGHVALDGTKQKANASKHKAMSYGRMKDESARLESEIEELLGNAQRIDDAEDAELGEDVRGDELPKELAFREGRLARIKQAMAELEAEAKAAAAEAEKPTDEEKSGDSATDEKDRPKRRVQWRKKPSGVPDDKAQKNFTDGESKIMVSGDKSFIQAYNAQAAVDSEYQVVVAAMVTNRAADAVHVQAMVEKIEENAGQLPDEMSLDAGYYSEDNVEYLEDKKIDAYMPPRRIKRSEYRDAKPGVVTAKSNIGERMKAKVLSDEGRAKYGLRKVTVEPVFGQIKSCMEFDQFSMRGQEACEAEWSLVCAAHNLLKLFRHGAVAMAKLAQQQRLDAAQATHILAVAA